MNNSPDAIIIDKICVFQMKHWGFLIVHNKILFDLHNLFLFFDLPSSAVKHLWFLFFRLKGIHIYVSEFCNMSIQNCCVLNRN